MRVFYVDFSWKSAILHAIYARVSAAMPMARTVVTRHDQNLICAIVWTHMYILSTYIIFLCSTNLQVFIYSGTSSR